MNKTPFLKIKLKPTPLFYLTFVGIFLFAVLCEMGCLPFSQRGYSVVCLAFLFFSLVRFEIRETPLVAFILPLASSALFTVVMQCLVGADPKLLNETTFMGNVALNASLTYLLILITNRTKISLLISNAALFIFAFIDYLVISFRGSEIKFADLYSIRTAASVVGQYKIEFTSAVNYGILFLIFFFFVVIVTKFTHKSKRSQFPRISGALFLGLSVWLVSWCMNNSENYMQLWAFEGTKYNGVTYNFLIEARDSKVVPPDGYSDEKAEKILSSVPTTESSENTPHIIVIMSEAFSDLTVLGDLKMNKDPLEFYNSLTENCTKGYALTSIYGGTTAVSEWEFLTGNTQAFLPYGSSAYQQYIKNEANSIVDVMRDNGYTTVAMHPYLSTGWRRDRVYEIFGFDEIYFLDDLSKDRLLRGFVTDSTLFGDIINRFENKKPNEKIFNFTVTMQNHGGYEWGVDAEIKVEGISDVGVENYLTLLDISDDALKDFISYFESYPEDTMIVFFGDHQPVISSEFLSYALGEDANTYKGTMKKHTVPFFIWTNYDTPEETVELTSLNLLSTIMMKKAGIGLTPYFSYLDTFMQRIPAISFFGYYSQSDGRIKYLVEAYDEETALINEYKTVQYKNVFAKKD